METQRMPSLKVRAIGFVVGFAVFLLIDAIIKSDVTVKQGFIILVIVMVAVYLLDWIAYYVQQRWSGFSVNQFYLFFGIVNCAVILFGDYELAKSVLVAMLAIVFCAAYAVFSSLLS